MVIKKPAIPAPREETLRQGIQALLEGEPVTALEISERVGIAQREVAGHLEHIRHSLHRQKRSLTVLPAECRSCGFVFAKRERLKRPGRCPVCRNQSISEPRYRID
ncbi:transcriptional regulator [Trichloromonas sp.]|uniref:transcriptional regulator n=1 Tax=Trichloromonas sp. TaxID=3069249 RepID=UPI003D8189EB